MPLIVIFVEEVQERRGKLENDLIYRIYQRYAKKIYIYLLALSHNPSVAEDIMQDVFYKAICSLPDSHENIRAWLYKVARNCYINESKKMNRAIPMNNIQQLMEERQHIDSILEGILKTQREQMLYQAILKLPEQQQKIVLLQYFSRLPVKEIATVLHLSPENIRVLSYRARKQLKKYMEGNGYEI